MRPDDAARLITFTGMLDARVDPASDTDAAAKAVAWASTIVDNAPLPFCQQVASDYYAQVRTDPITPGHFNMAWADHQRRQRQTTATVYTDAHCGRSDCPCTHDSGCVKGWLDRPDATTTTPCPRCRPWTAQRVQTVPPPGRRDQGDLAYLRGEGVDRSQPLPGPRHSPEGWDARRAAAGD